MSSALRKYAGPQHFCLFRGMCSAWVPGSVIPLYSVTAVTSRPKFGANPDRYVWLGYPRNIGQKAKRRNKE